MTCSIIDTSALQLQRAGPVLIELLKSGDSVSQVIAAHVLIDALKYHDVGYKGAVPALKEVAKSDDESAVTRRWKLSLRLIQKEQQKVSTSNLRRIAAYIPRPKTLDN